MKGTELKVGDVGLLARLALLVFMGLVVAGCHRSAVTPTTPVSQLPDPFRDVTAESGIEYRLQPAVRPMRILESFGSGCGFVDYDSDERMDVLLVGNPRCALYRNLGGGRFADVTAAAGLAATGAWVGCASGDFDNDGDADLLLTGYRVCALLENQEGVFRDVTRQAGIAISPWSTVATFADLDRDGKLDLYIGAYADFGPHTKQYCYLRNNTIKTSCRPFDYDPIIGRCYRNLGKGRFEDVTVRWGLDKAHGRTLGVSAADYDRDGWPDLFLANDELEADLYRNRKGQGFESVAVRAGCAYGADGNVMGGMGADWGDYDRDGWQDLLVGTYEFEPKPLFRNLKGQSFETLSGSPDFRTITHPWVVWGSLLFDYDNDASLDVMFVNGHVFDNVHELAPTSSYRQPAGLFRNTGDGTFVATASAVLGIPIAGRGLACADYDDDGDLDVLVQDIDGPARLLENRAPDGRHWIKVVTRGTKSNRDGFGAVVRVSAAGVTQTAEVRTSRSYASACDPRLLFGLGNAAQVDLIEVRWPSGSVTRMEKLPVDRQVVITEGGEGAGA